MPANPPAKVVDGPEHRFRCVPDSGFAPSKVTTSPCFRMTGALSPRQFCGGLSKDQCVSYQITAAKCCKRRRHDDERAAATFAAPSSMPVMPAVAGTGRTGAAPHAAPQVHTTLGVRRLSTCTCPH